MADEQDRGRPEQPHEAQEPESKLDAALGAFKPRKEGADTSSVSESGRPRLNWDPVTDTGSSGATDTQPRSSTPPRSSFQFDLGSALARLGGADRSLPTEVDPTDDPDDSTAALPVRSPAGDRPGDDLPTRRPPGGASSDEAPDPLPTRTPRAMTPPSGAAPVVDRLPTRTPRPPESTPAPADAPLPEAERPAARQSSERSVFEEASPPPTLPATNSPSPRRQYSAGQTRPMVPAGDADGLPTLPASVPTAPPAFVAPIQSAPSTPELNALRAAQLRAHRNERQGKLFGRSLMAFLVLGGLVAAALLFGRAYLFPTEWTAELTPLVDEIQLERGVEFESAVVLVEHPEDEYGPLVTAHVLGSDWNTRLPEWRALGLAGGDGSVSDVQLRVASLYPAYYDAETEEIVAVEGVSAEGRESALRLALETAFAHQLTGEASPTPTGLGLTGLESVDVVARRAMDAAVTGIAGSAPDAVADLGSVPVPVAYQLRAIDELGSALLDDPAAARPGDDLPERATRLDDAAQQTAGGLRQPGEEQVLEPVALGADDWALIWGSRLAPAIVGPMADSLVADSYSVVNRSGATCFLAVFQTDSEASGAAMLANLTSWSASAPVGAQAVATQLGPDRVQLEACDPGPDGAPAAVASPVDLVLQRQLDRLAG